MILTTARLCLRPRTLDDYDACLAMDRDPEVTRFIDGPWADAAAHEAFLHDRMTRDWGEGLGYWSIFRREEPDGFLGWVFLVPHPGGIEIGWRLVRAAWGQGYASEAAAAMLAHAFGTLGARQVVAAGIHPDNIGSQRVAEKLGMRLAGQDHVLRAEDWRASVRA